MKPKNACPETVLDWNQPLHLAWKSEAFFLFQGLLLKVEAAVD